jgi:hypothetical protein
MGETLNLDKDTTRPRSDWLLAAGVFMCPFEVSVWVLIIVSFQDDESDT